ncbi:MAG: ribosome maturation factor RimP [Chlorobiaceae bacterium]
MQKRINSYVLQIIAESAGTKGEGVYLIDLKVQDSLRVRKIEVIVDTDTGISIDQCAWLNRRLRERLESNEQIGEDFELTVSSPGLGAPIILPRQYIRHCGKLMKVTYSHDDVQVGFKGRLLRTLLSEESRLSIVMMPEKRKKKSDQFTAEEITIYLHKVICAVPEVEL